MLKLDPHGALFFQQDAGGEGAGEDVQVRARQIGRDIGLGSAVAFALFMGHLVVAHPFLLYPVEVGIAAKAGLNTSLYKQFSKTVGARQIHHIQWPIRPMKFICTALIVLGFPEIRQHLGIRPARVALGGPVVVVGPVAAGVDHGVERAGAAQYLAARLVTAAAIQARLWHGVQAPAIQAEFGHGCDSCRAVNQDAFVRRASFKQGNMDGRVLRQACRQHTASRAASNDQVVKHGVLQAPENNTGVPVLHVTVKVAVVLEACPEGHPGQRIRGIEAFACNRA